LLKSTETEKNAKIQP